MASAEQTSINFYERHKELLDRAVEATRTREYFSPYPESPSTSVYGENAPTEGEAAFRARLDAPFALDQPASAGTAGQEVSPYGFPLGITYPASTVEELISAAQAALPSWRDAGPDARAGIAVEALRRLNQRSFEMGHAVQHTTGQAFLMAFQAGGTHAQERGLEAVAYAYAEQTRHVPRAEWTKPQRKGGDLVMEKNFTPIPRGIALLIGCATFPTWNGYPALFASLVTGNPVIAKPHPGAILPLAITVEVLREVIAEAGLDPNTVTLAAENRSGTIARDLALRPEVRVIDFTGSTSFGDWLEDNARQAVVYTEKSGLNTVLVDSTDNYRGMLGNLAFSLSLYSGQMCTTPQNILVPRGGVTTDQGRKSPEEFGADLSTALGKLLGDPQRAVGVLGAIVNSDILTRLDEARGLGAVACASQALTHPEFTDATVRTPVVVNVDASDTEAYTQERFGPISFVISVDSTEEGLTILRRTIKEHGALTASVYSTDEKILEQATDAAMDAGVHLSENLTGGVFVNQTAAFSDFHGTAANPAATASLSDPAFVTGRFHIIETRRHIAKESTDA